MSQSTNGAIIEGTPLASIKILEADTKTTTTTIITDSTSPKSPIHRLTLRDKYLRKTEYLLNVKGKEIAEALAKQQGNGPKTLQQQKEEQDLLERLQRTCKKLESRRDRVLSLEQNTFFAGGYALAKVQRSNIERKLIATTSLSSKRTESRLSVDEKYLRKTEWLLNVKRQKIEVLKSLAKKQIKDPISEEKKQINHTQLLALERECVELERERVKQLREQTQKKLHRTKMDSWQMITKSNRSRNSRSKTPSRRSSRKSKRRSPKRRKSKSRHSRSPRRRRRKSRSPRRRKSRSPRVSKRIKSSRDDRRRRSRSPVLRFSRSPVSRYSRSPTSRYSKSPRRRKEIKSPTWRSPKMKSSEGRRRTKSSSDSSSTKPIRKLSRHRESSSSSRDKSEGRNLMGTKNNYKKRTTTYDAMAPPPPTIKATVKPVHLYHHQDDSDKSDNIDHNDSFSDGENDCKKFNGSPSSRSASSSSSSSSSVELNCTPPTPPPPPTFHQFRSSTPSPKRSQIAFETSHCDSLQKSISPPASVGTSSNTQLYVDEQKLNNNNGYGGISNKSTTTTTNSCIAAASKTSVNTTVNIGDEKIESFNDDTRHFRNKSPPIVHTNWRPVKDTGPLPQQYGHPTRIQLSGRAQLRFQLQRLQR